MKGRLRAPHPPPADTGRCTKSFHPKGHGCRGLFPPPWMPPSAKLGLKPTISELWHIFFMPHCCTWGAFGARVGCLPRQGASHAALEE